MSKGVTFYFVRHGETYFNFYGRMQGWSNAPLTPKGIEDVKRSGKGLADVKFDAVYTSDLSRTIETANYLLGENNHKDGLELQPMKEFREVGFGYFEGLDSSKSWNKAVDHIVIKHDLPVATEPGMVEVLDSFKELDPSKVAENYAEFWMRVESGLLEFLNRHAGTNEKILVVCHGLTIRNLLHGLVAEFDETDPLDNASVSKVQYIDGHFRLLAYNKTSHFTD